MQQLEYLVILEHDEAGWGAYAPDVPGCIATGATRDEAEALFREALEFHLEGLALEGLPLPEPRSQAVTVRLPV